MRKPNQDGRPVRRPTILTTTRRPLMPQPGRVGLPSGRTYYRSGTLPVVTSGLALRPTAI